MYTAPNDIHPWMHHRNHVVTMSKPLFMAKIVGPRLFSVGAYESYRALNPLDQNAIIMLVRSSVLHAWHHKNHCIQRLASSPRLISDYIQLSRLFQSFESLPSKAHLSAYSASTSYSLPLFADFPALCCLASCSSFHILWPFLALASPGNASILCPNLSP